MKTDQFLQKIISLLFKALFFLVPLFFTPLTSELFEFNKIILVYGFTVLITGVWLARMAVQKKILFKKSFFDIPLLVFLISQFLSTLFSIDPHTSLFGYYSRFNGGLLSTLCFLLLYWAFVANCSQKTALLIIKFTVISGVLVSVYGIFEHFGHSFSCLMFQGSFDVSCWVQKVQERVFATFGQPNWLAAYLCILIPVTWHYGLNLKKNILWVLLFVIFYSCLIFTQSRSGFLGFLGSFLVFWGIIYWQNRRQVKTVIKPFLVFSLFSLLLIIIFGSPFSKINNIFKNTPSSTPVTTSSEDGGISQSSDIRKIVWKGAWGIFKHYPLFGSGVETFAYSYYNFRPIEHNLVSEWDFLYNKAHNEYLNYLSTTGIIGMVSYLFFIGSFIYFFIKKTDFSSQKNDSLTLALTAGWISILITNFFGFSVVVISLYFFFFPALLLVLQKEDELDSKKVPSFSPSFFLFALILLTGYFFNQVIDMWRADYFYNQGQKLTQKKLYFDANEKFVLANQILKSEPLFLAEVAFSAANLAQIAEQEKQTETAEELSQMAINKMDKALSISPANLNLHKTKIKLYYSLSLIKPELLIDTVKATLKAIELSPTDPKLVYNLGLLYGKAGNGQLAIETIEQAVEMKPNYVDAHNALALFYEDIGDKQKALEHLQKLIKLAPENKEFFEQKIENLK